MRPPNQLYKSIRTYNIAWSGTFKSNHVTCVYAGVNDNLVSVEMGDIVKCNIGDILKCTPFHVVPGSGELHSEFYNLSYTYDYGLINQITFYFDQFTCELVDTTYCCHDPIPDKQLDWQKVMQDATVVSVYRQRLPTPARWYVYRSYGDKQETSPYPVASYRSPGVRSYIIPVTGRAKYRLLCAPQVRSSMVALRKNKQSTLIEMAKDQKWRRWLPHHDFYVGPVLEDRLKYTVLLQGKNIMILRSLRYEFRVRAYVKWSLSGLEMGASSPDTFHTVVQVRYVIRGVRGEAEHHSPWSRGGAGGWPRRYRLAERSEAWRSVAFTPPTDSRTTL